MAQAKSRKSAGKKAPGKQAKAAKKKGAPRPAKAARPARKAPARAARTAARPTPARNQRATTSKKVAQARAERPVRRPRAERAMAPAGEASLAREIREAVEPKGATKGVPAGFHTVTPHLVVAGAAKAIDFYKQAFGAVEIMRMAGPDGRVMHAELQIGDSMIMLCDDFPEFADGKSRSPAALGDSPVTVHMYVPDCDRAFERALRAGCSVVMELADQFWGDRYGSVKDPFGHHWSIATNVKELTPEEIRAAMAAAFGGGAPDVKEPALESARS